MRSFLATPLICLAFGLMLAPRLTHAADAVTVMADSCGGCHGTDGHSIGGMPAIAGKKADELRKVLREFKTGAREATVMDRIAQAYSVEQLDAMADYFASRKQ